MIAYLGWISLYAGLTARVFVPWLAKRRKDPDAAKWDFKRFVLPQLLSLLLIILVLPLVINDLESMGDLPFQAAWLVGWAGADIGRKTYKALADEEW